MNAKNTQAVVNFLFEAGMLAKTPRSGFFFLGSGEQSVAEHLNRVTYIGYALAKMNDQADLGKVLQMCIFHDFAEARVSDLNYVHQKYTKRQEDKAVADLVETLPFGDDIDHTLSEYEERESLESKLVKDADNLELLLCLKEQVDIGNTRAESWMPSLLPRIKTEEGQQLAEVIMTTDSDAWWFGDKNDRWWIDRKPSKQAAS
ncbi:MAG: HD domain-containing protein [Gammaproteobacteria bacterium]|nr:HD domain-containing protein [Gammaproteobacteria bacterium]